MKLLKALLFIFLGVGAHAQVQIVAEQDIEKNVSLIAFNNEMIPYTIRIEFVKLENLESRGGPIIHAVAKPGKTNLVELISQNLNAKVSFDYNAKIFKGEYFTDDRLRLPNYLIPLDSGHLVELRPLTSKLNGNASSKNDEYVGVAFMFEKPALICSPRKGIISEIKMDKTIQPGYVGDIENENFIEIYHPDGSFSRLVGLKGNSSKVKVGDTVFPGQPIAESYAVANADGFQLKMIQSRWQMVGKELFWLNFPVILTDGQNKFPSNSAATIQTVDHPEHLVTLEMDKKELKNYLKKGSLRESPH